MKGTSHNVDLETLQIVHPLPSLFNDSKVIEGNSRKELSRCVFAGISLESIVILNDSIWV